MAYQMRTTSKRLKNTTARLNTTNGSDLAIDGVALKEDQDGEKALSEVKATDEDNSEPNTGNPHDKTGRRTALASIPPSMLT